jgi:P-type Mg2+ transporter
MGSSIRPGFTTPIFNASDRALEPDQFPRNTTMITNIRELPHHGAAKPKPNSIGVAPILLELASLEKTDVFTKLKTSLSGLSQAACEARMVEYGPNAVAMEKQRGWLWRLFKATRNLLVILLAVLAAVSFATGDLSGSIVMTLMLVLGVALRFVQESRADAAAAKLKAMISVTATVVREGREEEIPLMQLVPGDVVKLCAGDMVPADLRLVASRDLFVAQAALTGESLPIEKLDARESREGVSPLELVNVCFLGTSVESGSATAVVAATGGQTYFGRMASSIIGPEVKTSFDKGMQGFTLLMIQFILVMVPLVFLINGLTKHRWGDAFFFSIAVAVGLTPEMLPMIVSVCLSNGALAMSKKKVIVKRLNSIQNLGAMDVLCTDKTGTLTLDRVILERFCDVMQKENRDVLLDAYLIAHFQTGLKNVLDRAVLQYREIHEESSIENYQKIDEIPFDFSRRMMSVVVETPDKEHRLLTKGAPESVFPRCSFFELEGEISPMEPILIGDLMTQYQELSMDGFRVLAVAYKHLQNDTHYSKLDESDLILKGYIAFLDPPKETAEKAIAALRKIGVTVKVLTGDNDLVTRKVCKEVGLGADELILGSQVETMTDEQLAASAERVHVFARVSPAHKQRIIRALQKKHVVGFMGDGINDAPALRVADVGISVDSGVDIAKELATVILLEKSLMVLEEGVIEGRKVFVNILKYIRMGASSNFGNMFSVLGASAFLPFLPMAPLQVLTNNLLYDFSQVPIPTDNVGPEETAKPRTWEIGAITRFILFVGPISSIFDYTTYFVMLYLFHCWDPSRAQLFQTGWFVESLMTQTLIIHVIRTKKIPFIEGRASWALTVTTILIMCVGIWLPYSPLAATLGFVHLPPLYWPILFLTLLSYVVLTQLVKTWLLKRSWL